MTVKSYQHAWNDTDHVVFFVDEKSEWPFLAREFFYSQQENENTVLLFSDKKLVVPPNVKHAFFIGKGFGRIKLFRELRARIMFMTLTDLNTFHLKRSLYGTRYTYIFHSLASTTHVYLENAFDSYDFFLCAGPHQKIELENRFRLRNTPVHLFEYGYPRIDELLIEASTNPVPGRITIAPTWGESGITFDQIKEILRNIDKDNEVIVRLHPMLRVKGENTKYYALEKLYKGRVLIDEDISSLKSLSSAEVLITDWSGTALEFAFGLSRPVISIDTKRKVRNKAAPLSQSFESSIRNSIGKVVSTSELHDIQGYLDRIKVEFKDRQDHFISVANRSVYNFGSSAKKLPALLNNIINLL